MDEISVHTTHPSIYSDHGDVLVSSIFGFLPSFGFLPCVHAVPFQVYSCYVDYARHFFCSQGLYVSEKFSLVFSLVH